MNTNEGSASIADGQGRLLFYTDGEKVWNNKHKQMPNGKGLFGNHSSTQSALIVPHPGDSNLYYLFTVAAVAGPDGMCYSVVDMRKDGGRGDVVQKNIQLFSPSPEKITAVHHANGKDVWVIGHELGSNVFRAYCVTSAGLNTTPVLSTVGEKHESYYFIGQMVAATDGSRIALAYHGKQIIEILDFDNRTGKLSNPMSLSGFGIPYGVSFSPDNSKLYATDMDLPSFLVQYDLTAGSASQIQKSRYEVIKFSHDNPEMFNSLQLGPDGKIYIARFGEWFLDAIWNPNAAGAACGYGRSAVNLGYGSSCAGLPNFIQSYFRPGIVSKALCEGDSTLFSLPVTFPTDSFLWDFGDLQSGKANTSVLPSPKHRFTKVGKYNVTLTHRRKGRITYFKTEVEIWPWPTVQLPDDTALCPGGTLVLDVSAYPAQKYLWNNGSSKRFIIVTYPGKYWIEVSNGPCKASDTIIIKDLSSILGNDTVVCTGTILPLRVNFPAQSFLWSDSTTGSGISVNKTGIYWVDMTLPCGTIRDSIRVDFADPLQLDLGHDTLLCPGDSLNLNAYNAFATYHWQDGYSNGRYTVKKSGIYSIKVSSPCGQITDTIRVTFLDQLRTDLIRDTVICHGDSLVWDLRQQYASYRWQDSSTAPRYVVRHPGHYSVEVSDKCHTRKAEASVEFINCDCYLYAPNVFSPNADGLNDSFQVSYCENTQFLLRVYNRLGVKVFESKDIRQGWDGTFNGVTVQEGLYIYTLQVRDRDKNWKTAKGQVTVVR